MSSTIQSYRRSMANFVSVLHLNMAAHMDPEQAHQREAVEHDGRSSALADMKFHELDAVKATKPVRYRECLKNHAASIGGYALDGCGEFMPSGEEGSLEALRCAACDCHRNFHRREVQGEETEYNKPRRLVGPLMPAPPPLATPPISLLSARPPSASQMIMALGGSRPDFEDKDGGGLLLQQNTSSQPQYDAGAMMRKRFRTKFTTEQKERMWEFAEMVGWRMPKDDEHVDVAQFCLNVGIKRHVLKVWMHNNKHTLGRKNQ